ncbi:putative membrane protein [Evansella vedderi]|uniref:Membrane protein n=1 Tax=Evansella vedderi TaxID=38282 RepID=A0ABT9ZUL3_9BACI|nr:hypothetical protein [Evansella vedderi]MDQ0254941.1 putative membrane protein [Evansella vedderi]
MSEVKKVWNPFKKAYWTKENLGIDKASLDKVKAEMKQAKEESASTQAKANDAGKKISGIGWKLTLMLTIPLILTVFFGVVGMVIGAIIFLLTLFSLFKK